MTEKRKYRRLSKSAWAQARALWEVAKSSLEELSARFSISKRALQFHFSKHGVSKGSQAKELAAAVEKEVFRAELADKEVLVERAKGPQGTHLHECGLAAATRFRSWCSRSAPTPS